MRREIRNSKLETRNKFEIRNSKYEGTGHAFFGVRASLPAARFDKLAPGDYFRAWVLASCCGRGRPHSGASEPLPLAKKNLRSGKALRHWVLGFASSFEFRISNFLA